MKNPAQLSKKPRHLVNLIKGIAGQGARERRTFYEQFGLSRYPDAELPSEITFRHLSRDILVSMSKQSAAKTLYFTVGMIGRHHTDPNWTISILISTGSARQ